MTAAEWARRRRDVFDTEKALADYKAGLSERPARGSAHKTTPEEVARWAAESERFEELLAAYRLAVQRWLRPEQESKEKAA